jgi:hypothetical protein
MTKSQLMATLALDAFSHSTNSSNITGPEKIKVCFWTSDCQYCQYAYKRHLRHN